MKVTEENVIVTMSKSLRDIFAFDESQFKGKGIYTGSGEFSLTRRILYLYIYSNISKYVPIGDTQAPLLAVIPFESGECRILREVKFQNPVYVPVRSEHISQIDMLICDGAGERVPFMHDATTVARLHFRKV